MNHSPLLGTRVTSAPSIQELAPESRQLHHCKPEHPEPDGSTQCRTDGDGTGWRRPNRSQGRVETRLLAIQGHSPSRSGCLHPSPSPAACKRRALGVRPRSADGRQGYGGTPAGRGNRDRPQNRLDDSRNSTRRRSGAGCNRKEGPNSLGVREMLGTQAGNKEGPSNAIPVPRGPPEGAAGPRCPPVPCPGVETAKKPGGRSHVSSSHGAGSTKR